MTFGVRTISGYAEDLADDAAAREISVTFSDVTDAVSDSSDERDLKITFFLQNNWKARRFLFFVQYMALVCPSGLFYRISRTGCGRALW